MSDDKWLLSHFDKQELALQALYHDFISEQDVASPLWVDDMTWYGSHGFGMANNVQDYTTYFVQVIRRAFSNRKLELDLIVCDGKICGAHGYFVGDFTGNFLGTLSIYLISNLHVLNTIII